MCRFCCGPILLASAYYKKLNSRARLFKKLALGAPVGHLIHDKMYVSLRWSIVLSARAQIQMDQSELRMKPPCERPLFTGRSQASEESRRGEF